MEITQADIQRVAEAAARKAINEWTNRAVPPAIMSRSEWREMMEKSSEEANEKMMSEVRLMFKSIGLDLNDQAETATKIKLLFRLQHNIGIVVLWGFIGIITAIAGGLGWLISAPWRK